MREVAKALVEKKGEDVVALDLRGLSSVTDFFLIVSGRSSVHVQALKDAVIERMEDAFGISPLRVEGEASSRWILMDYDDFVVHIFYEDARLYYDLEGLWIDAKRIKLGVEGNEEEH